MDEMKRRVTTTLKRHTVEPFADVGAELPPKTKSGDFRGHVATNSDKINKSIARDERRSGIDGNKLTKTKTTRENKRKVSPLPKSAERVKDVQSDKGRQQESPVIRKAVTQ